MIQFSMKLGCVNRFFPFVFMGLDKKLPRVFQELGGTPREAGELSSLESLCRSFPEGDG